MDAKSNPKNLELYKYNCNVWFEKEESAVTTTKGNKEESAVSPFMSPLKGEEEHFVDISSMPPLEDDEEVKE